MNHDSDKNDDPVAASGNGGVEIPVERVPEPDDDAAQETVAVDIIADLQAQLDEARQNAIKNHDHLLRKAAELENTRRRLTKEKEEAKKYGVTEAAKDMVPVLDDLELALEHARKPPAEGGEQASLENFVDGMDLVRKKFAAALEKYGITGFDSVGQPFDPKIHEAISQQTTDSAPDGTVFSEFLKGYMIHGRLLRPALVIVAKNPDGGAASE